MAQSDWKIKKKLLFCGAMILLVLLITGTSAARFCMDAPLDAVAVAILDGEESRGRL